VPETLVILKDGAFIEKVFESTAVTTPAIL
jgi:hypothetical protein